MSLGNICTEKTIAARIGERKLKPGDRLWVAGDAIPADGPFRQGNSPTNGSIYLRWKDLKVEKIGKIEENEQADAIISPGQGLSLFIETLVHSDFNLISSQQGQSSKAALAKLAEEKGYENSMQIHWFKMAEGKIMPSGLEVIFDNKPEGHCILSVTRTMTVKEFLSLVQVHLDFTYVGTDIFGKN